MSLNKLAAYAKFIVGIAGGICTSILTITPGPPGWLIILSAAITAAGVYLTPNTPPSDPAGTTGTRDTLGP